MDKYIIPNPNLNPEFLINDLRRCINKLVKLVDQINETKISMIDNDSPDLKAWIAALSFMTRKLCALHLGTTDYDYDFKDIQFSLIRRENKNDSKST